jgi:hypothetical protein
VFQGLRRGLRSDDPLELLAHVSGMLTAVDPRSRNPFGHDEPKIGLDDLVESFVGTDFAETTAALTVIGVLTSDRQLAKRLDAVLSTRRQPMPPWLTVLDRAEITGVSMTTHVLGDGDDYFIEATLPTGEALTALVYVDHNLGTVVKDAFIIPDRLAVVLDRVEESMVDPDQTIEDVAPAKVRAIVSDAIDHGARMYPPLESDSWPACRPIVEWLTRMLPEGGSVPQRPEWSEAALAALRDDFFASPYGQALDNDDERSLLESLNWFGTDYGPGDPLRWSPVNVEIVLADWVPRKIMAEPAYLSKLPDLLRAFIRYCHAHRGLREMHTQETLAAVDHWEPEYQRVIRSDRPQGPAALLAGLFDQSEPDPTVDEIMLESLDRAVGGRFALMNLEDTPLPDEPFEWAGIPDDIHGRVQEVLDLCDRCADDLLDVEHRTAMRRFLSRAAAAKPAIFRRKGAPGRGAAAVAWVIAKANKTVANYWGGLEVQELLAWFGVKGSVSARAEPLLRAVGVDPHWRFGAMDLGAPDLLVAQRRRGIIEQRDQYLSQT